jgi:hypothetical protein
MLGPRPAHAQQVCGTTVTTLLAGQTIPAGTVTVYNDATFIYVHYSLYSPWLLSETHVSVAPSVPEIPQTKTGNPIPGRFSYNATHDPELTHYLVAIPLGSFLPGQTVIVAAHAALNAPKEAGGSQTGWGSGPDFPGKNWATYIRYTVVGCGAQELPPE